MFSHSYQGRFFGVVFLLMFCGGSVCLYCMVIFGVLVGVSLETAISELDPWTMGTTLKDLKKGST